MPSAKTTTLRAGVALLAIATGVGLAAVPAAAGPTATPDGPALARQLVHKVNVTDINRDLIALQRIADRNNHNRAAGTKGHTDSADYFAGKESEIDAFLRQGDSRPDPSLDRRELAA